MIRIKYIQDKNPLPPKYWMDKTETCPFMENFLLSIKNRLRWSQGERVDVDLLFTEVGDILQDEYNCKIDDLTRELEFEDLKDLTFFILKWS
jgi:hypothetical protein